jgi:branched-chain amino acid transport system substrate-binding protein
MATMFWAEAVKKAGSTDVDAVIEAWEGLAYDGIAGKWYMRPCDHQAQVPYWAAEIVKDNEYYDFAYIGDPIMIPAASVEVACEDTGCERIAKQTK